MHLFPPFCGIDNAGSWIAVMLLPYGSAIFDDPAKFHIRPLLSDDSELVMTVFLTTFDMIEQLLNDAEFRTFGEAVILIGTVQVALNEAERCTGTIGGVRGDTAVDGVIVAGLLDMTGMGGGVYGLNGFFFGDGVQELSLC